MERWDEFFGGTRRAPRFALQLPISYRPAQEAEWRVGHGTNISRSGVLFVADHPLRLRDRVEMSFSIPTGASGRPGATIVCSGRIVRQTTADEPTVGVTVAATIESYRFQRRLHG